MSINKCIQLRINNLINLKTNLKYYSIVTVEIKRVVVITLYILYHLHKCYALHPQLAEKMSCTIPALTSSTTFPTPLLATEFDSLAASFA